MFVDCPTCKLLQKELSEATKSHFFDSFKGSTSPNRAGQRMLTELESLKVAAGRRRDNARVAFKQHETAQSIRDKEANGLAESGLSGFASAR